MELSKTRDESNDGGTLKRSNRQKKKKRFFDDDTKEESKTAPKPKTKPTKVKEKQIIVVDSDNDKPTTKTEEPSEEHADEEEKWLEALEKGELDDNGDLPKTKDLSLLTARQRAKLVRASTPNQVEGAPILPKEELTEEAIKKRDEKNKKRKLQAVKRAEESKKQTIERLVQSNKLTKDSNKGNTVGKSGQNGVSMIKYVSTVKESTMSLPEGVEYPLKAKKLHPPPPLRTCSICGAPRKYDCAKTGVSLCSLACYKKNLETGITTPIVAVSNG